MNADPQQSSSVPDNEADANRYGWGDRHIVLRLNDEELLEVCATLGQGSLGVVEEVRRKNTELPTFVRKRVKLPFRNRKNILQIIQEEAAKKEKVKAMTKAQRIEKVKEQVISTK